MPRLPFETRMNYATGLGLFDGLWLGAIPFFLSPDMMGTQYQAAFGAGLIVVVAINHVIIDRINR